MWKSTIGLLALLSGSANATIAVYVTQGGVFFSGTVQPWEMSPGPTSVWYPDLVNIEYLYYNSVGDVYIYRTRGQCTDQWAAAASINATAGFVIPHGLGFPANPSLADTFSVICIGPYNTYTYKQYVPPVPSPSCTVNVLSHPNISVNVGQNGTGTASVQVVCDPQAVRVYASVRSASGSDTLSMNGVVVKMKICPNCTNAISKDINGPYTFNPTFSVTSSGSIGQVVSGSAIFNIDII